MASEPPRGLLKGFELLSKNRNAMRRATLPTIFALASLFGPLIPCVADQSAFDMCGEGKRVTCVVDGDTFWLKGEKIRIANIDTPELGKPACLDEMERAAKATRRLVELLNGGDLALNREGLDQYGRTLATLGRDGVDIGDVLVAEGLARTWTGRRESWC
jgi:micrococcal nuclease